VKHCRKCGALLTRKMFGDTLEDLGAFKRRHFCGRACMAEWMEGQTKVPNKRNGRRQGKKQRKEACEECGTIEGMIIAHHRDENPLNNEPSNVVTLCQSCHMKGHWREWKKTTRRPKQCKYCDKPARRNEMCPMHATRMRRHGSPD
jgi:hypothetical protein